MAHLRYLNFTISFVASCSLLCSMFSKPPHHEMGTAQTTGIISTEEEGGKEQRERKGEGSAQGGRWGSWRGSPSTSRLCPEEQRSHGGQKLPKRPGSGPPVSPWLKPCLLGLSSPAMLRQCADGTGQL